MKYNTNIKIIDDLTNENYWNEALKQVLDWSSKQAFTKFRLANGHDCLAKHPHCIGILQSPE